jgi:IclR family mhp operon transcriptional activator
MTKDPDVEDGAPIRSISRAIAVLRAINRGGSVSMMDISRASQLPYPTACRIVATLQHEGLVEREKGRKRYRPTALVHTLSHGYQGYNELIAGARPHLAELTRSVFWPVSFVTRVGQSMVVLDSTHHMTSMTFNNYHPGYSLPILECASGLAYLAHTDDDDRTLILDSLDRYPGANGRFMLDQLRRSEEPLRRIRQDGYAVQVRNRHTLNPGKTSSIAIPMFREDKVTGAVTLVFFSTAMSADEAVERYLPGLRRTAQLIQEAWSEVAA